MKYCVIALLSLVSINSFASDFSVTKETNDIAYLTVKTGESVTANICKNTGLNVFVNSNDSSEPKKITSAILDDHKSFDATVLDGKNGVYLVSKSSQPTGTTIRLMTSDNHFYLVNVVTNNCQAKSQTVKALYLQDSKEIAVNSN